MKGRTTAPCLNNVPLNVLRNLNSLGVPMSTLMTDKTLHAIVSFMGINVIDKSISRLQQSSEFYSAGSYNSLHQTICN